MPPHITVREALERLRHEAPDRETIYYCYVVDHNRRLIGFVSLKKLILSRRSAVIEDIMQRDVIFGRVDEDQEAVARQIDKYDLLAIPIVDATDMLVGIITHDDAMDILRQEQTEDILAFGGVSSDAEADEETYWQGRIVESVRRRIGWLLLLFLAGTITRYVITSFNWVDSTFPTIEFDAFIPLLIGTGGNAGSQTVGTIIRGLALGEIQRGDAPGCSSASCSPASCWERCWARSASSSPGSSWDTQPIFAAVIGLAILGICMWANGVGALVPLAGQAARHRPRRRLRPLDQHAGRRHGAGDLLHGRDSAFDQAGAVTPENDTGHGGGSESNNVTPGGRCYIKVPPTVT